MEEKYILSTTDTNHQSGYEQIAKELGGSWDGEELLINNSWLEVKANSICFLEDMFIDIFNLYSKKPILVKYSPDDEKHFIIVRIGFTGSFYSKEQTKKFTNLGVFIYNSSQKFELEFPVDAHCQWITLRFSLELFNSFNTPNPDYKLKTLFDNKSPWLQYFSLDVEIENHVKTIIANVEKDKRRHITFFSRSADIMGAIIEKMEKESSKIKTNIHPEDLKAMMQLKDTYLSDFSEQPNLTELSEEYGMSVSKLNRIFKSIFDQPVLQFYNQMKVEEVHRQISYTDKSLTEIAFDLNFSHIAHMSKVFKKYYGFPPSDLRDKK
ncbi:helix-turn-helix domain-containing protein [Flammeovirga yaeyamensis]|uniref:Helix-turn-helix domain-containing protein n=1 Tax=Flammeovirga yaeyamensis TaxID=367791 RepID=A0AAX1NEA6_9BACT|nr:AraC family transcriptional regulator [Flammeovirga yaeyamensis]MBB3697214.1 AraC-like DNA-binding protein [Flammeovirga yaeyamensis]NMF33875.1 helix-turn-helix transcriptional regulator [Flammeovirga yaeyamensis]QWG04865.1 helix-turn-helix domain-containing protein [Flammeovirga yaeyamensis]